MSTNVHKYVIIAFYYAIEFSILSCFGLCLFFNAWLPTAVQSIVLGQREQGQQLSPLVWGCGFQNRCLLFAPKLPRQFASVVVLLLVFECLAHLSCILRRVGVEVGTRRESSLNMASFQDSECGGSALNFPVRERIL